MPSFLRWDHQAMVCATAAITFDEDVNSRSATFDRKRSHGGSSRGGTSNGGSAQSTPRKRAKHAGNVGHQFVEDFVPAGGSFTIPQYSTQKNGGPDVRSTPSPPNHEGGVEDSSDGQENHSKKSSDTNPYGCTRRRVLLEGIPLKTPDDKIREAFAGFSVYVGSVEAVMQSS